MRHLWVVEIKDGKTGEWQAQTTHWNRLTARHFAKASHTHGGFRNVRVMKYVPKKGATGE